MQDVYTDISEALKKLDFNREPSGLYSPIAYALESGGKRMRPALALMATDMLGGRREDIMPAALALEVFHNFTLLHDDLMDNADTRRGRPAVHKKWNKNTAILSGDQMLIESYKLISQTPQQYLTESLELFSLMASQICEGQQYDMDFEQRRDVTIAEYTDMIRLKTAVLPATALQLGALVSAASETIQKEIYLFGINLGLAFQLRDDYLDVFGDPATFGKTIGGDILDKKKTYLYITAYKNATPAQAQQLDYWFDCPEKETKIKEITQLYKATAADMQCLDQIGNYHRQAALHLQNIEVSPEAKQPLSILLDRLLTRNK